MTGNVVSKSLRSFAALALAGSLALAACQTTEGEGGTEITLFSGDGNSANASYSIFWDQGDHIVELTEAGKLDEAAKLYAKFPEFFDEDREKYMPRLMVLADAINKREKPALNAQIARIDGAGWPSAPAQWSEVKSRLTIAGETSDAYWTRPLLADGRFASPAANTLKEKIGNLESRIRTDAAGEFAKFDHFGERAFFKIYPVELDETAFLYEHFGAIRDRLAAAGKAELERFAGHFPREIFLSKGNFADADPDEMSGDSNWRELSDLYVGAVLREPGMQGKSDLATVLRAVDVARKAGFHPKTVPNLKISFVEVTSRTLLKEGQIEFPAEIVGDLPVQMVKADLDKALTNSAAKAADYLIVFDVAMAKTRRRITGKQRMPSRLIAGYRTQANPDYNMAQNELNQSQMELQNAQMQSASANAQFCQGFGCLGKMIAQIANIAIVGEAQEKNKAALAKLGSTPMTIEVPVYRDYNYDLAAVKGTKLMTVHYYVIDRKQKTYFKSTFDVEEKKTFNVAYSVHPKDPDREEHLENADTDDKVAAWEEAASSVKLSRLADHYLKNIAQSKPLPVLADLRREMLRDKNRALAKFAATKFDARPLNDPRFDSVVVVYPQPTKKSTLGTGFFIKPDVVLTNWHVVDGAKFVEMKTYDKQETFGKVIAQDVRLDLALIRVQSRGKPVRFYTERTLDLGKTVEVIGHPRGLEFSITRGVVSAVRRHPNIHMGGGGGKKVLFIQTDAPINPGNSGGPLFLGDKVIGVNAWKQTGAEIGGLNFSIHYSEVMDFLREYLPGYQPAAGG